MRLSPVWIPVVALLVTAPACSKRKAQGGGVSIDGSSTVFLISAAAAERAKQELGLDVAVGSSGTGGGFKKFCAGELDLAGASRPIKASEAESCKKAGVEFIELPVAYDGLAVVVNRKNTFVDYLTVEELKKMWAPEAQGTVDKWSHIREGWPDQPLRLLGPGTDSGTYDYFTQAIVGKEHSSRGDFRASEDDNVLVQGVAGDENALGFFGFAYYAENQDQLKIVPIEDGKPDDGAGPITPTADTIRDGTYQPLSRPIFIYVSVKAAAKPHVRRFVDYYLTHASELATKVGYVGLPEHLATLVHQRFTDQKTGSVFPGGSLVGVTLQQLLADEGK